MARPRHVGDRAYRPVTVREIAVYLEHLTRGHCDLTKTIATRDCRSAVLRQNTIEPACLVILKCPQCVQLNQKVQGRLAVFRCNGLASEQAPDE